MVKKTKLTLYTDPRLTSLGVLHGTTDRSSGNMRLAQSTGALFRALAIPEENILRFKQIHSDTLCIACTPEQTNTLSSSLPQADGWILSGNNMGAAIITADCVPLFIWDETARLIGLSHCGWRGVAAELPAKTVQALRQQGAQGRLSAWAGPHIQACCFEVQADTAAYFPQDTSTRNGKLFVDLNHAIRRQLIQNGLEEKDIVFSPHCTCCEPEHFFSYRRDHTPDALLSFVYRAA